MIQSCLEGLESALRRRNSLEGGIPDRFPAGHQGGTDLFVGGTVVVGMGMGGDAIAEEGAVRGGRLRLPRMSDVGAQGGAR